MKDTHHSPAVDRGRCTACPAAGGRRQFLRDAAAMAAGALAALGASPARAAALPMRFANALHSVGTDKTYAIPAGDGVNIDKQESVIIARYQNLVFAMSLACPHQNTALKWQDGDKQFLCPKHHSAFRPDGVYIDGSGRATRAMDRFAIRHDGANVAVDLDKLYQADTDAALWKAAFVQL